jgi:hypothetical protein
LRRHTKPVNAGGARFTAHQTREPEHHDPSNIRPADRYLRIPAHSDHPFWNKVITDSVFI